MAKKIPEVTNWDYLGGLSRSVTCARRNSSQRKLFTCIAIAQFARQIVMTIKWCWKGSIETFLDSARMMKRH